MFGFISLIADALELLARGGGGGSAGGGGIGGGYHGGISGGMGSTGGTDNWFGTFLILTIVGYVTAHGVAAVLRKTQGQKPAWRSVHIATSAITVVGGIIMAIVLPTFGIALAFGALIGAAIGLYGNFRFSRNARQDKAVTQALATAASTDSAWDEAGIKARVNEVFMAYQRDWSARNWQNVSSYATPRYTQHATLMIAALLQAKRIDRMENVVIDETVITDLRDNQSDIEDMVTIRFIAHANDTLIDEVTGETLFVDTSSFTEYWTFRRVNGEWMLDQIEQATADGSVASGTLRALAESSGYFYSLDWGWLLIPRRGNLFGLAKFGTSDINNHIIGVYNNTYLLQLYTYSPNTADSTVNYLIAQTNVPKEYGRIVVRRKKWANFVGPTGLRKISMEWGDFNKKYDVYASSAEGPTSFELLHPVFMEKLEALDFEVNIEVVDNVVYLYAPHKLGQEFSDHYSVMLSLLQEAYTQMRM